MPRRPWSSSIIRCSSRLRWETSWLRWLICKGRESCEQEPMGLVERSQLP